MTGECSRASPETDGGKHRTRTASPKGETGKSVSVLPGGKTVSVLPGGKTVSVLPGGKTVSVLPGG